MEETPGYFYDGVSAQRHNVRVSLSGQVLRLGAESLEGGAVFWPLGDLRRIQDQPRDGSITLCRVDDAGDETQSLEERLVLKSGPLSEWLVSHCPALDRPRVPAGTGRRVLKWVVGATVALGLMLFVILPGLADILAKRLPLEQEMAYGRAVTRQVENMLGGAFDTDLTCRDQAGQAALEALVQRLTEGQDLAYDLRVVVFDHEMVNAFAAPGGQIVVLRGLIEKSPNQAALAGVLAHEIGHVEHRDPTRQMLRAVGSAGLLSLVLGDFAGGIVAVTVAEQAVNSSYGRKAESAADGFGLLMLNAAGVSSEGFARLFDEVLTEEDGLMAQIPSYLQTHPQSALRAEVARQNAEGRSAGRDLLSPGEWRALQRICD